MFLTEFLPNIVSHCLLATEPNVKAAQLVLAEVLLSLVFIYLASKLREELSKLVDLSPVLGELVAKVIVRVSALHLLVFPEAGAVASDSVVMTILQQVAGLSAEWRSRSSFCGYWWGYRCLR